MWALLKQCRVSSAPRGGRLEHRELSMVREKSASRRLIAVRARRRRRRRRRKRRTRFRCGCAPRVPFFRGLFLSLIIPRKTTVCVATIDTTLAQPCPITFVIVRILWNRRAHRFRIQLLLELGREEGDQLIK